MSLSPLQLQQRPLLQPVPACSSGPRRARVPERDVSCAASQVTVVGAGAAGLTAAYFAAEAGAQVRASDTVKGGQAIQAAMTRSNLPLDHLNPQQIIAVHVPKE